MHILPFTFKETPVVATSSSPWVQGLLEHLLESGLVCWELLGGGWQQKSPPLQDEHAASAGWQVTLGSFHRVGMFRVMTICGIVV